MSDKATKAPVKKLHTVQTEGTTKGRIISPANTVGQLAVMRQGFVERALKPNGKGVPAYLEYYDELFKAVKGKTNKAPAALRILAEVMLSPTMIEDLDRAAERARMQNRDLLLYSINQRAFDIQRQVIESVNPRIYCMAGRRAGKTEAAIMKAARVIVRGGRVAFIGKTFTVALDRVWNLLREIMEGLSISITESRRTEGYCQFATKGELWVFGNSNVEDRERRRGEKYDLIIIDESQSQQALAYFIDSILEPMLLDTGGTLLMIGTAPRVRGTYWEYLWTKADNALRLNWDLRQNPHIKNHTELLSQVMKDKALSETSPLFVREYLGRISYDDDALVLRFGAQNYFTDQQLADWVHSQPVTDIRFSAGLDFGFEDADGFAIICYSTSRPEWWVVYEYKARRTGVTEVADAIKAGLAYIAESPIFGSVVQQALAIPTPAMPWEAEQELNPTTDRHCYVYADTGGAGKKIAFELATQYGLPCQDAYKADKDMGIEMMQDEVRRGLMKVREGGPVAEEALRTVFGRNDKDELTREIDDDTYHPDVFDAILYARRPVWLFEKRSNGD